MSAAKTKPKSKLLPNGTMTTPSLLGVPIPIIATYIDLQIERVGLTDLELHHRLLEAKAGLETIRRDCLRKLGKR